MNFNWRSLARQGSQILKRALFLLRQCLKRRVINVQRALFASRLPADVSRLVIFMTPGWDAPAGGVLSISSLYKESVLLTDVHQGLVVLCSVPTEDRIFRYTWFREADPIFDLRKTLCRYPHLDFLLLHVPEYYATQMASWIDKHANIFPRKAKLHINVMVQNIDDFRSESVGLLRRFADVTCTTAHEAYSTEAVRNRIGVPLHKLSVFISPEQYTNRGFRGKKDILVYSPDDHPLKERVLHKISSAYPHLKQQMIQGLTYDEYKTLIGQAKWAITFGEGLDGYFIEPILSGGLAFAVYNDRFFTAEFADLSLVYPDWETMLNDLPHDMVRLDEETSYNTTCAAARRVIEKLYDFRHYRENLRRFYLGQYTFP